MLVDLGRNDLGRVCTPGSVVVKELMVIEKYSHVMHIVSEVEGTLKKRTGCLGLINCFFPSWDCKWSPKNKSNATN